MKTGSEKLLSIQKLHYFCINLRKKIMRRNILFFSLAATIFFLTFIFHSCEKDPVKGWTFYKQSPPPLQITKLTSSEKLCSSLPRNFLSRNHQFTWHSYIHLGFWRWFNLTRTKPYTYLSYSGHL